MFDVVKICMVLKPDYQTFAMLFMSLGEMKVKVMVFVEFLVPAKPSRFEH